MNIRKFVRASAVAIGVLAASAANASIMYATGGSNPWGQQTNDAAMNTAFGSGNWSKSFGFNTGLFSGASFVFLDGSDSNANQLSSFIASNLTAIESYVSGGGRLFINAAPNVGSSFSLGFGANLNYADYSSTATVTTLGVAAGLTNGGIATNYSGGYFSHASVSGADISKLISDNNGDIVFGAKQFGAGFVAFGGQTTSNFHSPSFDSGALRVNELLYVSNAAVQGVPEPETLALFALGLLGVFASLRRKA